MNLYLTGESKNLRSLRPSLAMRLYLQAENLQTTIVERLFPRSVKLIGQPKPEWGFHSIGIQLKGKFKEL